MVPKDSKYEEYIIGFTIPRIKRGGKLFHRFIRIDYALPHIEKAMEGMQILEEADTDYHSRGNQTELSDKIRKRRKL